MTARLEQGGIVNQSPINAPNRTFYFQPGKKAIHARIQLGFIIRHREVNVA